MMRLLGVELTRLRKRRAVLVLLLGALVAPLLIAAGVAWSARPVTEVEAQDARDQVAAELASPDFQDMIDECVANPAEWGVPTETAVAKRVCFQQNRPRVDWYLTRPPLRWNDQKINSLLVLSLTTALMMLAASTFIGHDWNSGSMSNQLLFEPRRQRVFWAKALAVMLMALLASALALALFWGVIGTATHIWDIRVPKDAVRSVLTSSGRGMIFVAAASVGAYAITNLFRSTVVTLGLMFVMVVASSVLISLLPIADAERFQLPTNVAAWVNGQASYYRDISEACYAAMDRGQETPAGLDCQPNGLLTLWGAAQYFGVLLLASVGASARSFHRRDVV